MVEPTLFLDESVKPDVSGRFPVKLVITYKGVRKRKTLFSVLPKDWDPGKKQVRYTNVDHVMLNYKADMAIRTVKDYIFRHGQIGRNIDLGDIIEPKPAETIKSLAWYLTIYSESIRGKASNEYCNNILFVADRVEQFSPGITVDKITEAWINQFYAHLGVENSTFAGYLKKIRKAIKIATKDGVSASQDALAYKVKVPKKIKRKLSFEEFDRMRELELKPGSNLAMVRDFFLLQVYLRGMRVGDLLTQRHQFIHNDRLFNSQEKTDAEQSIKLVPEAVEIINRYRGNKSGYLIPFLKIQPDADPGRIRRQVSSKTAMINDSLSILSGMINLDFELTTHVARHTYAVMGKKLGVPIYILSKQLGHTSIHSTEVYLAELMETETLDDAADEMFNKIRSRKEP